MVKCFKKLRKIVEILSYGDILMGLTGLIGGSVLLVMHFNFEDINDYYNIYKIAYCLLITIGVQFLILGIIGICGQKKQNDCFLTVYNTLKFLCTLATIIFLIVQMLASSTTNDLKDDSFCQKEEFLIDYKTIYDAGKNLLCSENCPCNAKAKNFTPQELSQFNINNKHGANNVSSCKGYDNKLDKSLKSDKSFSKQHKNKIINMLREMESTFQCSGFCSINNYYIFNDINKSKPKLRDCKQEFVRFLEINIDKTIIITSLLLAYLIVSSIFSACLILKKDKVFGFYPERKNITENNKNFNLNQNNKLNNQSQFQQPLEKEQIQYFPHLQNQQNNINIYSQVIKPDQYQNHLFRPNLPPSHHIPINSVYIQEQPISNIQAKQINQNQFDQNLKIIEIDNVRQ